MEFVIVSYYISLLCAIQYSESFNWTLQPANPTLVTKGEDESLTWEFNLTADEQAKSQTFYLIKWKKFNQAISNYDQIAGQTFVSVLGTIVYTEPRAPHIEVDKKETATLLINNVRREDEGTYKIEYSLQIDGTVLADHEVNVTVSERPQIIAVSKNQDICEGSTVTLSCNATGRPAPNITWTRVRENGTDSEELPSVDGFYVIRNISRSSSGTYRCTAFSGVGDPVNHTMEVIVRNSAHLVRLASSASVVIEGDSYNLSCEVYGDPMPSVNWIKVSDSQRSDGNTLKFSKIDRNDAGDYRCEANNRCGTETWSETVDVFFKPDNVTIQTNTTNRNGCSWVKFTCNSSEANPPVHNYMLVMNNSEVSFTKKGTWTERIPREETFVYKCVAYHQVDNVTSRNNVTLTVVVPAAVEQIQNVTAKEGTHLAKECNVTAGIPPPTAFWENVKSGQVIQGNLLNITEITRYETEYRCIAKNLCGRDSTTMIINVLYRPDNVTLGTNTTENNACFDILVTFTCNSSEANPPVHNYMLLKNGTEVSFSENGKWMEKISRGETFIYSCVAYQLVDNVTSRNSVTVTVKVPVDVEYMQKITVIEGAHVRKECSVTAGTPPLNVFWENGESGHFIEGKLLNVAHISRYQTMYKCIANNTCGRDFTTMFIDVQYKPSATKSNSTIKLELGEHKSIGCPVDIGNPSAVITWYKGNDTSGNKMTSSSTLEVNNASLSDEGWYTCLAKNVLGNETVSLFLLVVKPVSTTVVTSSQTTPVASESTEVFLTATIQESCSRRLEVAAKFPEVACQVTLRFGCSSANSVNTRCGSVVLDFMMRFNQSVMVDNVLTFLSDAAMQEKFGAFKVHPGSIKQVLIPTDDSENTIQGSEEVNDVLFKVVIGVLAFIILLLIIYIIWQHRKEAVWKQRTNEDERGVYDNEMALKEIEPSQPASSKLSQPPAEYMDLMEVSRDNKKAQSAAQGADYAPLHPLTRSWEVPRLQVTIEKIIGKGAFGQVAKGTAVGLRGRPEKTTVAIKMLKFNASESDKRDLIKELETMKQLKPHPYVIKLLGCVTDSEPLLVLIEYVPFGDLLGYLRKSRGLNDTYYKDPDVKPHTNLTSQQLVAFAWQIADGMSYLSSKSIIHRDLAARNVLVGQNETCKVTDFGMARDVQKENIYERKTKGRLPVKWTAYEALLYGKYTTKSDVWSFGVVLYEIFTIGGSPYPRMDGRKIANLLQEGYRMARPQHVDEKLYQIMMNCWQNDPDARPTFSDLKKQLKDMESLHKRLINMHVYYKQLYGNVEDLSV